MKVLVACEESQAVAKAFRKLGHEAYSCDIQDCSGGEPQWHIKGDALKEAYSGKYDLMIAHPPCTYLAVSGARWMYNNDGSICLERLKNRNKALDFVKKLLDAPIEKIALENPVSVISSAIRKPDQIIQPYEYGHSEAKKTCLWLKNLPKLKPTKIVNKGEFVEWIDKNGKKKRQAKWYLDVLSKAKTKAERQKLRSKTYQGIADAMAQQWSI
tara:strand:+ start:3278 stop:3916 length:639 start_codon:yes stop_codon:yes gene_type:complete